MVIPGLAGIAGPVLFTLAWLVGALVQDRYLWRAEDISDLAAPTANHTWIMTAGFAALGIGLIALSFGFRYVLDDRGGLVPLAVLALGIGVVLLAVFPSDCSEYRASCQEYLAGGNATLAHRVHNLDTGIIFPFGTLVPLLVAGKLGSDNRLLRTYSIGTTVVGVLLLGLYLLDPFPGWNGLLQRLFASTLVLWVAVMGSWMLWAVAGEVELVRGAVDQSPD